MYPSILMSTISRNISSVRSFHIVNCVFTHNHNCATIRFKQRCFPLYPFIPFALELTCRAVTVYYCALSLVIYVLTFHFHGWPFCVTSWKNFTSKQYECNAFVTLPLYTFETWPWINDGHSHSSIHTLSFSSPRILFPPAPLSLPFQPLWSTPQNCSCYGHEREWAYWMRIECQRRIERGMTKQGKGLNVKCSMKMETIAFCTQMWVALRF